MALTLQENRRHQNQILEILIRDWNPSSLPHDQAACEYESDIPDIYRRLLAGTNREELTRSLYEKDAIVIATERRDPSRWSVAEQVADKLLSLGIRP